MLPTARIGAHELTLLRNGREVFPAMLAAIAAARSAIALEMYWVEPDAVGRAFRDALAAAARRGVRVRVILDGFGSLMLPERFFDAHLRRVGAEVRRYRPMLAALDPWRPLRLLARDHRKIMVVDDEVAFVSGLNLCAHWAPREEGGEDWRDTAVCVRGPDLSRHTRALIDATWARTKVFGARRESPPNLWTCEGGRLGIIANRPASRRGRKIRQAYLWGLRRARESVDITCAYFAPRPMFLRALAKAVARGVRVRLLLPLSSDVWLAELLADSWIRTIAERGVEVYGYAGGILHAKTAVVDGRWVTIGSHNLDALSWAYNLECNVFCADKTIGAAAVAQFEDDLRQSVRLPRVDSPRFKSKVTDGLANAMAAIYSFGI